MTKIRFFLFFVFIFIIAMPVVNAIVEEDFGNYTRIDESRRDGSGSTITVNWLKKSYYNAKEDYKVVLNDFDSQGFVSLNVSFRGKQETFLLREGWVEEAFNKTMIITVNKLTPPEGVFTCCPEAEINIDLIRPELDLEFIQGAGSYRMYEEIPIEISITNYGEAETTNTEVFIDTGGMDLVNGQTYYQLPSLGKDEKRNIKMILKFPYPPKKLSYSLYAYVKGVKDGMIYYYDGTQDISIKPSIELQKYVTEETMLLSRKDVESQYRWINPDDISRWVEGGIIYVTLGVTNYQNYEIKEIKIKDSLPPNVATENGSLNWTFDLKPYETKELKYQILARSPGEISLPKAMINYTEFNFNWVNFSDSPSTKVHGPCIQIFKRSDKPVLNKGETAAISISIRNIGDMPSKVKVIDSLPENSTFLEGHLYYEGIILPKESASISYNISISSEGQIQLPTPRVYVANQEVSCMEPSSGKIMVKEQVTPLLEENIWVNKTIMTPTPVETKIPEPYRYTWLEGVIPALMLILAVAVLIMLHRSSK